MYINIFKLYCEYVVDSEKSVFPVSFGHSRFQREFIFLFEKQVVIEDFI